MALVRRQVADPSVGVSDLMKVLRAELASCNAWDLWAYLSHLSGSSYSWKTAPHPAWLTKNSTSHVQICCSGCQWYRVKHKAEASNPEVEPREEDQLHQAP